MAKASLSSPYPPRQGVGQPKAHEWAGGTRTAAQSQGPGAGGGAGRPVSLRELFKASGAAGARGRAGGLGSAAGCVAMDVGADEFEQSLPLLQELVMGADFVGKAWGLRACRQRPVCQESP